MEKTEIELKAQTREKIIELLAYVLPELIKYTAFVLIAYFVYLGIATLAGKDTNAFLGLALLNNDSFKDMALILLALVGLMYGKGQRKVRKETVKRMSNEIKTLKDKVDAGFTSSRMDGNEQTEQKDLPCP